MLTKSDLRQVTGLISTALEKNNRMLLSLMQGLMQEELKPIREEIAQIKETLNVHTTTLDAICGQIKILNTEMAAVKHRLNVHDKWFKIIADKVGVTLVQDKVVKYRIRRKA